MPSARPIVAPMLVLVFAGLSIVLYLWANVDSFANDFAKKKLNEFLSYGEFVADFRSANFVPGSGLEIHGFQLYDARNWGQPIVEAESLFVRFPTDANSIVSGQARPTAVDIQHFRLRFDEDAFRDHLHARIREVLKHKPHEQLIPIRIRDSTLIVKRADEVAITFDQVMADLTPDRSQRQTIVRWLLTATNQHFKDIEIVGGANLDSGAWRADLKRGSLQIDDGLLESLSTILPGDTNTFAGIVGRATIQGVVKSGIQGQRPQFEFDCHLSNVNLRNRHLPVAIGDVTGHVRIKNDGLVVERATGRIGSGNFDVSYWQTGFRKRREWQFTGTGNQLYYDSSFESLLNSSCQKFCKDFSPQGFFDIKFDFDSGGSKNVSARIADMSMSYRRFPYRVDHCVGNVNWVNEKLTFNMQAREQQQLLEFSGQVKNPGKHATYTMNFGTNGRLPIDEKAIRALSRYPSVERAFRDLRPAGYFNGHGQVIKSNPNSDYVKKEIRIGVHDANVRHRKFDYPIQNVNGAVQIDDTVFKFLRFTGVSGSTSVNCNGGWNLQDGLDFVFDCDQVDLNARLRNALTPNLQQVWDGLRPTGQIKFSRVFLNLPPGAADANIQVQSQLGDNQSLSTHDPVSIFPEWFPYRLDRIQGQIDIGDGRVSLSQIRGKHGRTWFSCDGRGRYDADGWNVKLNQILAGSVVADEELLLALPDNLANAVRQLNYEGQINLSGEFGFAGSNVTSNIVGAGSTLPGVQAVSYEAEIEPITIDWDVRLDIDQGKMIVGLPMKNIFGAVRLKGVNQGSQSKCYGDISVDSLTIYDLQVTNIQGPVWIDNLQSQAGKFAKTESGESASLQGDFGHGKVTFDGWVSHDDRYPFFLQTTLEHTKLEEIASTIAPQFRELSGDGYGFLRMQGNANELHTYNGEGSIHLRNARIHQLPVVLSLLKILNIKEVNRTAFDSSNVDFSIEGNRMKLERIELIGDAISLIGNGYLELMRHVDINFYSVVGRNRLYIPLVSELYKAGSQRIMWISIGGPFGNLQTTRKMLPGLDDSLRKLLGVNEDGNRSPARN